VIVMLRRLARSGRAATGAITWASNTLRITIFISSMAKLAPMHRRRPPPNGIQV
jgi:hypothetical protein